MSEEKRLMRGNMTNNNDKDIDLLELLESEVVMEKVFKFV